MDGPTRAAFCPDRLSIPYLTQNFGAYVFSPSYYTYSEKLEIFMTG
jgi:hypothetical protein